MAARQVAPTRRELREALAVYAAPSTTIAVAWFLADFAVLTLAIGVTIVPVHWTWKALAGLIAGIWIARLFIIGHDACHQSLTPYRWLNRVLGRLAFLPSLTPYSLWELGHNLAHHGFTNLRGRDTVWTPLDAEEFNRLSRVNQWLQKAYRSGWGVGLYYLVELWWDKLVFPPTSRGGGKRAVFARDRSLVAAFALCWIGVVALGASTFESSVAAAIVFGVLLPFTIWNCLMGFVIYVHHTAPEVVWYDDGAQWSAAMPYCTATIHVEAPWMDALLHRILQHPAHHVDMTIPFYRLRAAQALLASIAPKEIRTVSLTWRYYWDVARCCKLYDYRTRQWQPFETRPRRTTVSSVA